MIILDDVSIRGTSNKEKAGEQTSHLENWRHFTESNYYVARSIIAPYLQFNTHLEYVQRIWLNASRPARV